MQDDYMMDNCIRSNRWLQAIYRSMGQRSRCRPALMGGPDPDAELSYQSIHSPSVQTRDPSPQILDVFPDLLPLLAVGGLRPAVQAQVIFEVAKRGGEVVQVIGE